MSTHEFEEYTQETVGWEDLKHEKEKRINN